ncbi:hypothetical protein KW835_12845 [Acidovorax sp. sic0104]|nr:hypothetical protein [Acidovorax sp. sic0104]
MGSGFDDKTLVDLHKRLSAIRTPNSPFANPEAVETAAHWVRPELLAEVSFADWRKEGMVKHAVFRGLCSDRPKSGFRTMYPLKSAFLSASLVYVSGTGAGQPLPLLWDVRTDLRDVELDQFWL